MNTAYPITIAAGTTTYAVVSFKEKLCKAIPSGAPLSVVVTTSTSNLNANGTITSASINALISVSYPVCQGGCVKTLQFVETVNVGVTGTATSITATATNATASPSNVCGCKANAVNVEAVLAITSAVAP